MILLHGFLGAPGDWELSVASGLDAIGVTWRAPWLPGHGIDASQPAYGAAKMEDFFEHLDEIPLEDGTLAGYSMGGRLALHYALARPQRVRRLILEAASPGLESDEERSACIVGITEGSNGLAGGILFENLLGLHQRQMVDITTRPNILASMFDSIGNEDRLKVQRRAVVPVEISIQR